MCFMIWVPMPNLFTLDTLLWGGLVALVASLIPYSLEMVALKSVRTQTFSLFMALEPVIAAVMGFLVLHQVLKWYQIVAMIMIIVAASVSALLSPSTAKN
jgi:inner membrane transporter RhtA